MSATIKASLGKENYYTEITAGENTIISDEPLDIGGQNKGLKPSELLASSLASCTAITLKMYMDRKGWTADKINIKVEMDDPNAEKVTKITRDIQFEGAHFSEEQIARLFKIAVGCPIHKILVGNTEIHTQLK